MRLRIPFQPRLLLVLFLTGAAMSCGGGESRPNVLLITLDTTRADYLGAYGRPKDPTPNLDALAAAGTRFDLAMSTAAVTPVAHAAVLTGRYNHEHGLRMLAGAGGFRLAEGIPTLADVLARAGYATAAIHSAFPVSRYFGLDRGFAHFDDLQAEMKPSGESGERREWDMDEYQRRSDETSDRALALLAETDEPFFLWLHYWDPHDKRLRPPKQYVPTRAAVKEAGSRELAMYAAEVSYVDLQLGRLFADLERTGRAANTIVVVISDHGEGLGDHGWAKHRILYQEQIRVPLIISAPGHDQVSVVHDLVRSIDVFPTILDYAGVAGPSGISGRSLRPLMEGAREQGRTALADQINLFDLNAKMVEQRPDDDLLHVAMDGAWKLTYRPTQPHKSELYHLAEDPDETRNLFDERPDEVQRLLSVLAHAAPWVTEPPPPIVGSGVDQQSALAALAALGYASDGEGGPTLELDWVWVCPNRAHAPAAASAVACTECGEPRVPAILER